MKINPQWITYRTRFLVKAKQLHASLTFTDALGRQHHGRKGDYLVESSDGVLRIAPRQIFEDIYVPLPPQPLTASSSGSTEQTLSSQPLPRPALELASSLRRKFPQPCRDRRSPSAGLRLS